MDGVAEAIKFRNASAFSASHSWPFKSHQIARAVSLHNLVRVRPLEHDLELLKNRGGVLSWRGHLTEFVVLVSAPEEASLREVLVAFAVGAHRNVVIALESYSQMGLRLRKYLPVILPHS